MPEKMQRATLTPSSRDQAYASNDEDNHTRVGRFAVSPPLGRDKCPSPERKQSISGVSPGRNYRIVEVCSLPSFVECPF